MTEADYLRGELIAARGLLAQCRGVLAATETLAPDFYGLPTVQSTMDALAEVKQRSLFLMRGVK